MTNKQIIEIISAVIVIALIVYSARVYQKRDSKVVEEAATAIEQLSESSPSIAPSVDVGADSVPAVNPLEKTNPFKNEYQNPFE